MKKILIVEDDVLFLKTLKLIFEQHGYEVVTAKDGKEGAYYLDQTLFDLVVTDLMLPFVNGMELVDKLRQNETTMNTPVIIVSSVDNESTVTDSLTIGADDYMKKPIIPRELLSRVDRLLNHRRAIA